ncbi:hypothetical protein BGZ89_006695, partial [Linnemannia elongata]
TNTVLLLMGDPGSGKTVFVKQLERKLWGKYNGLSDSIPILVKLSEFTNPANDLLGQVLQSRGFHPEHIQLLKRSERRFILICDGYDEAQVQVNIYNQNRFNREGQWVVKMIIACRSDKIGRDSDGRFQPEVDDRYSSQKLNQFQKLAMAPFTYRMVVEYVEKYANRHLRPMVPQSSGGLQSTTQPETPPSSSLESSHDWSAHQYMETLSDVPNLMKLVENPFILSIVLIKLSTIANPGRDVLWPAISLEALYQHIFGHWFRVAKRRLHTRAMTRDEDIEFRALLHSGFEDNCMEYTKFLVVEFFRNQKKASLTEPCGGRGVLKQIPE